MFIVWLLLKEIVQEKIFSFTCRVNEKMGAYPDQVMAPFPVVPTCRERLHKSFQRSSVALFCVKEEAITLGAGTYDFYLELGRRRVVAVSPE